MEPLGDWTEACPWKSRLVLLMYCPDNGTHEEAVNTVGDKRRLLGSVPYEFLFAVWPGQWSSTARYFEDDDPAKVLERL